MGISLVKGQKISLEKGDGSSLTQIYLGAGWDVAKSGGGFFGMFKGGDDSIDLDASLILFNENNQPLDAVWFGQLKSKDGSIWHSGDNRTGAGDGDDESVKIDLSKVPAEIQKIAITVTIHEGESRGQNFGQVQNAFIRIVNDQSNTEIVRFDLNEDYSTETAMIFGELYRHNGEWKFRAVGQGYAGGLGAMCRQFGISI